MYFDNLLYILCIIVCTNFSNCKMNIIYNFSPGNRPVISFYSNKFSIFCTAECFYNSTLRTLIIVWFGMLLILWCMFYRRTDTQSPAPRLLHMLQWTGACSYLYLNSSLTCSFFLVTSYKSPLHIKQKIY